MSIYQQGRSASESTIPWFPAVVVISAVAVVLASVWGAMFLPGLGDAMAGADADEDTAGQEDPDASAAAKTADIGSDTPPASLPEDGPVALYPDERPTAHTTAVPDDSGSEDGQSTNETVTPAPPVASELSAATERDTAVEITLRADAPSGDPVTFAVDDQPDHGTVTLDDDVATYTPDDDFEGADTFTYTADDGHHTSEPATVTVDVTPPAPDAHDVDVATDQADPVVVTLDADNHSDNDLAYHYDQPDHGTVTGDGPEITYTPDDDFHGADTFTYHVNDGHNDSNPATVTITVDGGAGGEG